MSGRLPRSLKEQRTYMGEELTMLMNGKGLNLSELFESYKLLGRGCGGNPIEEEKSRRQDRG